jgi:DNA polymerase-3 subunit gamma/tau
LREKENAPARILFVRAIRKLLARFNPLLWEDDPKKSKIAPLVNSLEEDLDELDMLVSPKSAGAAAKDDSLVKLTEGMLKSAFKLESEGMGETIPIAQIRRAASWSHLAPAGNGKIFIIENADRMQEESRNSLLKLLEEPPPRVTMVLTSARPGSLLPTMLSRLRPYRFSARNADVEREVIRRVFKDQAQNGIAAYLDSFLPVSGDALEALAAFFAASVAYKAAILSKKQGRPISDEVVLLGKYCAPKAEAAGLGRPQGKNADALAVVLDKADKFEIRSLFSRFICCLLDQVSLSRRHSGSAAPPLPSVPYNEMWKKCAAWAETSVCIYNLRPAQVLEKLFTDLSRGMADL